MRSMLTYEKHVLMFVPGYVDSVPTILPMN